MTKEQLEVIVGMIAGMQTTLVHVATVLDSKGVVGREDFAASLDATAEAVPANAPQAAMIKLMVKQVALGIRSASTAPDVAAIRDQLH